MPQGLQAKYFRLQLKQRNYFSGILLVKHGLTPFSLKCQVPQQCRPQGDNFSQSQRNT